MNDKIVINALERINKPIDPSEFIDFLSDSKEGREKVSEIIRRLERDRIINIDFDWKISLRKDKISSHQYIDVRLEVFEQQLAISVGTRRRAQSLYKKIVSLSPYLEKNNPWWQDVEGAAAEIAVAKAYNLYWNGSVNTFHAPDVFFLQVRKSRNPNRGLVITTRDNPKEIFVFVTGEMPRFKILGWIRGVEGQREEWFRDYKDGRNDKSYFVPLQNLHSPHLLYKIILNKLENYYGLKVEKKYE